MQQSTNNEVFARGSSSLEPTLIRQWAEKGPLEEILRQLLPNPDPLAGGEGSPGAKQRMDSSQGDSSLVIVSV